MPEQRKPLADRLARGVTDELSGREAAIVAYVERLTLKPNEMRREDVEALRRAGLSDREIHDTAHVAAYFAYVNRIALGLGAKFEGEQSAGQWPGT